MAKKFAAVLVFTACLGVALAYPLSTYEINPENAEAGDALFRVKKASKVDDSPTVPLNSAAVGGNEDMTGGGSTRKRSSVLLDLGQGGAGAATGRPESSVASADKIEMVTSRPSTNVAEVEAVSQPPSNYNAKPIETDSVPAQPPQQVDESQTKVPAESESEKQAQSDNSEADKTGFVIAVDHADQPNDRDDGSSPVVIANPEMPKARPFNLKSRMDKVDGTNKFVDEGEVFKGPLMEIAIDEPRLESGDLQGIPPQALLQMMIPRNHERGYAGPIRKRGQDDTPRFQLPQQSQNYDMQMSPESGMLREIWKQLANNKQILMNVAERQTSLQDSLDRIETHFVLNQ